MADDVISENPKEDIALTEEELNVNPEDFEKSQGRYSFKEMEDFITEYQRNGRNATKAIMVVRPWLANKPNRAAVVAHRMLKKVDADSVDMVLALRSVGVGAKKIAEKIMQLLDGKKIIKTFRSHSN